VRDWKTALKWAGGVYGLFWAVAIVLSLVFGDPKDQNLVTDLKAEDSTLILVGWAILICVLAPVVEEIFFRGFMFGVFIRRMPLLSFISLIKAAGSLKRGGSHSKLQGYDLVCQPGSSPIKSSGK